MKHKGPAPFFFLTKSRHAYRTARLYVDYALVVQCSHRRYISSIGRNEKQTEDTRVPVLVVFSEHSVMMHLSLHRLFRCISENEKPYPASELDTVEFTGHSLYLIVKSILGCYHTSLARKSDIAWNAAIAGAT